MKRVADGVGVTHAPQRLELEPAQVKKAPILEQISALAPISKPTAQIEVPGLGPLDAVGAVIYGALGPPTSGGPLTAHQALQLSREAAHQILDARDALPSGKLDELLAHAEAALDRSKPLSGKALDTLTRAYVHLAEAETFAQAVLDEATEGARRAPTKKAREAYAGQAESARALLRGIGKAYAVRCPEFGKLMQGDKEWPTRYEKVDGKLEFINGFKSVADLDPQARRAEFEQRLQKYLAAGGTMEAIFPLSKDTLDRLEVGERYEYVLTTEGQLNVTIIPKQGDGPSPGHTLTAENGIEFKDTRAHCAGELWVARGSDGELSALCISAGSGHYKPFFDSLSTVDPVLAALGLDAAQVVHYGGPSSARDAARTLLEKAGASADDLLPMRVHDLRLALHVAA